MGKIGLGIVLALALLCGMRSDARMLMRPVSADVVELLKDPGFESADTWKPYEQGFIRDTSVRRSGKAGIRCESTTTNARLGAMQVVELNQKVPRPVRAWGHSWAEKVSTGAQPDYSIYLDVQYDDGSWLWGQIAPFHHGSHGWEYAEVTVNPARPIRRILYHVLFRNRTGKVWFDDMHLNELKVTGNSLVFEGVLVQKVPNAGALAADTRELQTTNGLTLKMAEDGSVAGGGAGGMKFGSGGGFFLRDVFTRSPFFGVDNAQWTSEIRPKLPAISSETLRGDIPSLGLQLTARMMTYTDRIAVTGTVKDLQRRDRAVTVGFALPVSRKDCRWGRDIYRSEAIRPGGDYSDTTPIPAGATGAMSIYPWGCLSKANDSLALAIPMDQPRVYRIGYNADAELYTISFDLGLANDGPVPNQADFSFVIYRAEGDSGFRAVTKRYYDLFPQFFTKRVGREGIWMPFGDIGMIREPEDFGFAYHEGSSNVGWDNAHGVYSFRYTEPMSYWMPMGKEIPHTPEKAWELINQHLASGTEAEKQWAMAVKLCNIIQSDGQPYVSILDTPWVDGALFILNPNPAIPETASLKYNRAHLAWRPSLIQEFYGKKEGPHLDGEYLDSLEMGAELLNFRRDHFRWSGTPLTFETASRRLALMEMFSTYDFMREMAADLHTRSKLLMANAVLWKFSFPAHLLDVLGTETNWMPGGKYTPLSDSAMGFRRAICYHKPYVFLQNTDFTRFGADLVEKYFQRCLFFGMYPGFFSENAATNTYFSQPALYERDRPLFLKYIPLIRTISTAGWEPVTMAKSSAPGVMVERYGSGTGGWVYFTVRNDSDKPVESSLSLDPALGLRPKTARKLPSGGELSVTGSGQVEFTLNAGETAVIRVDAE